MIAPAKIPMISSPFTYKNVIHHHTSLGSISTAAVPSLTPPVFLRPAQTSFCVSSGVQWHFGGGPVSMQCAVRAGGSVEAQAHAAAP